jgi:hypothetical protein
VGRAPSRRQIARAESRSVEHAERLGLYPNGKRCVYCGHALRDAADEHSIYTLVASGIVFLHPHCAVELGQRLVNEGTHAADVEPAEWYVGTS